MKDWPQSLALLRLTKGKKCELRNNATLLVQGFDRLNHGASVSQQTLRAAGRKALIYSSLQPPSQPKQVMRILGLTHRLHREL
eukprot:2419155-Amphidinium_carterae.2